MVFRLAAAVVALIAFADDGSGVDPCDPAALAALTDARAPRVGFVCELRAKLKSRYVAYDANADGPTHGEDKANACIRRELAAPASDGDDVFTRRVRECIATFHDTHLVLRPQTPQPITDPVLPFALVAGPNGSVLVSATASSELKLGAIVTAIDGIPIAELVAASALQSGRSTEAATRWDAVLNLVQRLYTSPRGASVAVETKTPDGVTSTSNIAWAPLQDSARRLWSEWNPSGTILSPADNKGLARYGTQRNGVIARLATAHGASGAYCYLKLSKFEMPPVERLTDPGRKPSKKLRRLSAVLAEWLAACDRAKRPLVIDLRKNSGGSLGTAETLLNLLMPPGQKPPQLVVTLRATTWLEEELHCKPDNSKPTTPAGLALANEMATQILAAQSEGRGFTPLRAKSSEDDVRQPYSQKIAVLTGPECVSTCDEFARAFQEAKRGPLIGTEASGATNGTFSLRRATVFWTDSKGLFELMIPNTVAGTQPDTAHASDFYDYAATAQTLLGEGKPPAPDVRYETSARDLVEGNAGWRELVEKTLSAP